MRVVTDTSAILNLSLLGLPDLLPTLFGETHAPRAVLDEFLRLSLIDPRFAGLRFPAFIAIHHVSRIHPSLDTPRLDQGECEALSLALEIGADVVLMDESAGRAAAGIGARPSRLRRQALVSSAGPGFGTHSGDESLTKTGGTPVFHDSRDGYPP